MTAKRRAPRSTEAQALLKRLGLHRRGTSTRAPAPPPRPKPVEDWTDADKRAMVAEIRSLVYTRYDGPAPTSAEDDPGWIAPPLDLAEPEPLDDPIFIYERSNACAVKPLTGSMTEGEVSAQDLFDLVDRPNRISPPRRFHVARVMGQVPTKVVGRHVARTDAAIRKWDKGEKIPEDRYPRLAEAVGVAPKFLHEGRRPFPSWLDPYARAVNGLALAARWMVTAGLSIPGVLPGPPGPGRSYVLVSGAGGKPPRLIPSHVLDDRDMTPVSLASRFLARLEDYLRGIRADGREQWFAQYGDAVIHLPFLPYVWKRMGELVYVGELPMEETLKRKSSKRAASPSDASAEQPARRPRKYDPTARLGL